jgi:Peptidase family M28
MTLEYILNKIYDFSKVKETFETISDSPNRLKFISNLLDELNIDYYIDKHKDKNTFDNNENVRNVVCLGKSDKMVIAHYDIFNWESENANDNSASVINAIALKYLMPDINIVLTDYEEFGCLGAEYLATLIKEKNIKWVLNLELTGLGRNLISSNYSNGELFEKIKEFEPNTTINLKKNDGRKLAILGIESETICTYPIVNGKPDLKQFDRCHKKEDNLDTIKIEDMKNFIEKILIKIVK